MPLSSHATAGAGRLGTLSVSQPRRAARSLRTCADRHRGRYGLQTLASVPSRQVRSLLSRQLAIGLSLGQSPRRCPVHPPMAEERREDTSMVTVGMDPHKHVHVAVAVDAAGKRIGNPLTVKNDVSLITMSRTGPARCAPCPRVPPSRRRYLRWTCPEPPRARSAPAAGPGARSCVPGGLLQQVPLSGGQDCRTCG